MWDDNWMTVSLCCSNRLQLEADAKALEKELKELQGHPTSNDIQHCDPECYCFPCKKIQFMFRLKIEACHDNLALSQAR